MPKSYIEIIYQDDDILVVNKPSGVSVTADRSGDKELVHLLARQLGPQTAGSLRLIHRLDKDTSGVMILAKNAPAQSLFTGYFENRLVRKTYLALVSGLPQGTQGTINAPLAPDARNPALMCVAKRKGKQAATNWRLLADFGMVALLAVNPLTGRTHQVLVHLSYIGLPLAIDPLYASNRPLFLSDFKMEYRLGRGQTEKPLIERLTLHAYQIELPKNRQARPELFIAGLDKKFAATLKMLTKYNPKGPDAFLDPGDLSRILTGQTLSDDQPEFPAIGTDSKGSEPLEPGEDTANDAEY